jgi:hypothetical protein
MTLKKVILATSLSREGIRYMLNSRVPEYRGAHSV